MKIVVVWFIATYGSHMSTSELHQILQFPTEKACVDVVKQLDPRTNPSFRCIKAEVLK
jgi:hypothetical protein